MYAITDLNVVFCMQNCVQTNRLPAVAAIGFNVETVTYKNIKFQVWDLGGQTSIRPYWRCYYPNTQVCLLHRLGSAGRHPAYEQPEHFLGLSLSAAYDHKSVLPFTSFLAQTYITPLFCPCHLFAEGEIEQHLSFMNGKYCIFAAWVKGPD